MRRLALLPAFGSSKTSQVVVEGINTCLRRVVAVCLLPLAMRQLKTTKFRDPNVAGSSTP
jgi:hypothetical protein